MYLRERTDIFQRDLFGQFNLKILYKDIECKA